MATIDVYTSEIVKLKNIGVDFNNFHSNSYFAINLIKESCVKCNYKYVGKSGDITLNFFNKIQKIYRKNTLKNKATKDLIDNLRSNMLDMSEFEMGVYYIGYCDISNKLYAGTASNSGISKDVCVEYDTDYGIDSNLSNLFDEITKKVYTDN